MLGEARAHRYFGTFKVASSFVPTPAVCDTRRDWLKAREQHVALDGMTQSPLPGAAVELAAEPDGPGRPRLRRTALRFEGDDELPAAA